jgi:hypothetical protein
MYDPDLSDRYIWEAGKHLDFTPKRYERDVCLEARAGLDAKWDYDAGRLTRTLTPNEVRWIRNEQTICRHDFQYFAERYAFIVSKETGLIPYKPNRAQRILHQIRAEHQRDRIAMAFINNKARQLGVSTDSEIVVGHRAIFGNHTRCLIASASEDDTLAMSQMMKTLWDHMPWWMTPRMTAFKEGQRFVFGRSGCSVTLQWLNQKKGLGRGRTPHVAHVSECSDCEKPEDMIEAALLNAMHDSPAMYLMLESTAKGMGNWWHLKWESAKATWGRGSRVRPTFLPWYIGTDLYPNPTWLRARPIPEGWEPKELTKRHAARAAEYVATNSLLRAELGLSWKMPREQMWYWEARREEAVREKTLAKFLQEMPASDVESFQLGNSPIFDAECIQIYHSSAREPEAVFGLRGCEEDIKQDHQPPQWEIDINKPPIEMKTARGNTFELVPLLYEGKSTVNWHGKIFVWEWPEPQNLYGIGVDTGFGVGQDRSVAEVCRRFNGREPPAFVAEIASDAMGAMDLLPFVYALHEFYKVSINGEPADPKLVIELAAGGEVLQDVLMKMGCSHFHRMVKIDRYGRKITGSTRIGAGTDNWFRNDALAAFIKAARDYAVYIHSPWMIQEMGVLGVGENYGKIEAEKGAFDDRIIAGAKVFYSLHAEGQTPLAPIFGLAEQTRELADDEKYARFPGRDSDQIGMAPDSPMRGYLRTMYGEDYVPRNAEEDRGNLTYAKVNYL